MSSDVSSAVIGAVSAFVVALLTVIAGKWNDVRAERKRITADYLNPLRLYVEEVHYRIEDIFRFPENRPILGREPVEAVSRRPAEWFNGDGCYFISTCYLTACLFAAMKRVRENIPYLKMRRGADTELLTHILKVHHEFLDDLGVFYVVQHSIGEQMWDYRGGRVLSYRAFCEYLRDPAKRVWFDRLLRFYAEVGEGKRTNQLRRAQSAVKSLSRLLDGGAAIEARVQAETSRWRSSPPTMTND